MINGINPGFVVEHVERIQTRSSHTNTGTKIQAIWRSFKTGILHGTLGAAALFFALKFTAVAGVPASVTFGLGVIAVGIITAVANSIFF